MKLHLPKALLTAVLAMCVAQDAWADWAPSDKYSDTDNGKIVFYTTADLTVVDKFNNETATNCTNIWIAPESNNQEHVFTNVYIADDDTLSIVRNPWGPSDNAPIRDFKSLTIESLKIGDGTGAATLIVNTNQNLTLNAVEGSFSSVTAQGSIEFTGSSSIGTLGMKDGGVVNFTGGTHTVEKMDIHNSGASTTETVTISGATVKITGSDATDNNGINGNATGAAAVTIGHWNNGGGKIVVGGETASASLFDVSGATIRMSWDSGSTLEIKENGTVNAKRIQFANDNGDNAVITLAGGRLNLGEGGISENSHNYTGTSKREINLNSGTLGALAESVDIAAGTTNIGGAVTIDTAIVDAEGEKTGETANISFSNNVDVLSDDAAFTVKGGGAVSFNALNVGKTLLFDVQDNTQVDIDAVSLVNGDLGLDVIEAKYSDNSEKTLTSNGFRKGEFVLFEGYEWNGAIAGYEVSVQDGDTHVTTDDFGATYYVNEGTHTISTAGDYINARALGYSVAENAGLVIDGASDTLSAADLLTGTTGSGNITIGTNITLGNNTATQVTGGLTIESGKTLQVGQGTGHSSTIASFSSVKLDGGTLKFHNNGSTVHNLTVSKESTLHVQDMNADESIILLDDTTTLDAKLNVTSTFKGTLQIEKLTGTGDLDIRAGNNGYDDTLRVNIDALDSYTGKISYTASAWGSGPKTHNILTIKSEKDFALSGLNVLAGKDGENYTTASAVIEAKGKADLGDVKVTNGSSVTLRRNNGRFYVVMDSLAVEGSATIQTADGETSNNSYETEFSIGKLVGTDATLKLRSGSNTGAATVFNLNGGEGSNFSGAIEVGGYNNNGDGRKAVLNINDSTIASNAEIRFNAENDKNTAYLALGADNVAVKGISDVAGAAQIVSGEVAVGTTDVKSDDTVRTLTINTQGNSYSTAAKIDKNINLVKSGEGTQTFSGDVSEFNGSVTVKEGELALTGASALSLNQLSLFDTTNATGGTLSVGSANGGTVSIVSAGSVVVGKGSVLNGNLTLGAGTALTLNGYGDNAATINGNLTLGAELKLAGEEFLEALGNLESGEMLKILNIEGAFSGLEADLSIAADAIIEEQPLIVGYTTSNYYSSLNVSDYALIFQGTELFITNTAPIPEPTTATLSLLALAALAARRRRK